MEVKKTKDHFTIEMEAYEYDYLIKAVDFGATWMDENGYREEQRRYENLRDDLKMYQSGEIRGRTLKERLDRCRILKSYESRVVVMTQQYLYEMENAVLKHQRDPEHIQDDVAKLTAEYNNKVSELYAERDKEIDAFDKETLTNKEGKNLTVIDNEGDTDQTNGAGLGGNGDNQGGGELEG